MSHTTHVQIMRINLHLLILSFLFLSSDWLEVYDGASDSSPMVGDRMCMENKPIKVRSSGNELLLKFHSDLSSTGRGYRLQVDLGMKHFL